jgi:NAD(P)-dependent dehydrogenase (short-subunit alcohol dehydrogenase family)
VLGGFEKMAGEFEEKVVLVTGGTYGIGRATALSFAHKGAKLALAGRNVEHGKDTVQQIKEVGGDAIFVKTDVSKEVEVKGLVEKIIEVYGKLDCAFNNAGIHKELASTIDFTEADWNEIIDVNLKGVWLCMKYEIPEMLKRGKGVIVNMSSAAGLVAAQANPAYPSSKHGVVGLTKSTAVEFAQRGIRVNAVCPGPIRTSLIEKLAARSPDTVNAMIKNIPMRRIGEPDEVAAAVVWLCSDEASYITGHALSVDGGIVAE